MSTPADLLAAIEQEIIQSAQDLHDALQVVEQLEPLLQEDPGAGIDWQPIDQPPADYGYYKVLMRVNGETIVGYSVWTLYQWANCFPVEERLGWAPA